MKIGVCADITRWKAIANEKFDYVEANFSKLASLTDEEFEGYVNEKNALGISVEAFNGFFPSGFCIYGELLPGNRLLPSFEEKLKEIEKYAEAAFSRARRLGGRVAVFGSSHARALRDGITREDAEAQVIRVLRVCGDVASKYGMKIALEPIRYSEVNFINTVDEGLDICKRVDHPSVGLLVDLFHFYMNGESLESVKNAADRIIHMHMARPDPDRKYPTSVDVEACKVWADTLYEIGYNERISLECSFGGEIEAALVKTKCVTDLFKYSDK